MSPASQLAAVAALTCAALGFVVPALALLGLTIVLAIVGFVTPTDGAPGDE